MKLKNLVYFDAIYNSFLLSYFLSILNLKGKKSICEKNIYKSFSILKLKTRENHYIFFFETLEKSKPMVFTKFKKKLTRKKQKIMIIPVYLKPMDQYKKAIKWLELSLLIQPEKNQYYTKLYNELYNFNIHKQSFILQKKQENYKFVIENKFNKHYRW